MKPTVKKKPNDQNEELFLLKTGTVLSISTDNVMVGVYNDGHSWRFKAPEHLNIFPNSKVLLYRYHLDTEPNVNVMLVVKDLDRTHSFIIGDEGGGECLIRFGVEKTIEADFYNQLR